jgi:hypothetical protein
MEIVTAKSYNIAKRGEKMENVINTGRPLIDGLMALRNKKTATCGKMSDPSWDDCRICSLTSYNRNCHNKSVPPKTDFTGFFSGLR